MSSARLDLLHAHCADEGLDVIYCDLGPYRHGDYSADLQRIRINTRLSVADSAGALAHEFGHHLGGDTCSTPRSEKRAWEWGAAVIITPPEYKAAEELVGHHINSLAAELEVSPELILAWRRWYRRAGHNWRW